MLRRAFLLLPGLAALAGCVVAPPPYSPTMPTIGMLPPPMPYPAAPPGPAPTEAGRGVAILLPLSGQNASVGQAMLRAAQLALEAPGAPKLDARDTGGTPDGAAEAARQAIGGGAGLILGPLTSQEAAAVAPVTAQARVPVLAFTSDPAQARPGLWVLGITPEQQVRRLVADAQGQDGGRTRFAAAVPNSALGNAMADALLQVVGTSGGAMPVVRRYNNMQALDATLRDLSGRQAAAPAGGSPAAAGAGSASASQTPFDAGAPPQPAPFDALLVAETGERAQQLAASLAAYDLKPPAVRILGPGLWAGEAGRLAALQGARFAAPDPAARVGFEQRFVARYGSPPPRVADLAFDAAAIANVLANEGGFNPDSILRPQGFAGVDGLFAPLPDGRVRRGLAVFEIDRTGAHIVNPAPDTLGAPGV